jgi:hypothetical protein
MASAAVMKHSDIRRSVFEIMTAGVETISLAGEAAEQLGYNRMKEEIEKPTLGPLAIKLAEMNIEVLDKDDVNKFKRQKQDEVARVKFEEWLNTENEYRGSFYGPTWRDTKISEYKEPIPDWVLERALSVKRECADLAVNFEIDWLEENPDPFLVVYVGEKYSHEEEYYIAVWDEPKFISKKSRR